ncbi:MAG TPA: hypothetical protein PLB32_21220, partial [Acidobacteriota bacterium]|nr:hypothetical protein [Acidobacteriota bacterium]
ECGPLDAAFPNFFKTKLPRLSECGPLDAAFPNFFKTKLPCLGSHRKKVFGAWFLVLGSWFLKSIDS